MLGGGLHVDENRIVAGPVGCSVRSGRVALNAQIYEQNSVLHGLLGTTLTCMDDASAAVEACRRHAWSYSSLG